MSSSSWSTAFNPDQIALYFVISLATTCLPAYLYHGVYGVDVSAYGLVYIIVILCSSALLTVAYKQAENNAHLKLIALRAPAAGKRAAAATPSSAAAKTGDADMTTLEAQSWSFFLVNLLYCAVFLALAFYVLKAIEVPYDYAVSSVIASAAAWQIAAAITK